MPSPLALAALAAALAVAPGPAPGDPAVIVYSGRSGQLAVKIPRIDTTITVDGTLAAPAWKRAAVLTGFSEYSPLDGIPAQDSTEVLVWYSSRAMYFGVRAFEPHGDVHYKLADRDKIDADDNIQIVLTPFLHSRQALVFAVNPLGVQEDGTMTEGVGKARSFNTGTTQTGRPATDLSPDFVYESSGHVTPYGYEVVICIPFRSIKYQADDPQDWGVNIVRTVQHSGHEQTWVPTKLAAASFLSQSGTLVGITGLDRGSAFDLNPVVTSHAVGTGTPSGSWGYGVSRPSFGSNMRWGITNNLTLTGTYRPDFAEVEADATRLVLDPRSAVSYPEKRPFFLEGLEQFSTPSSLVYTRAIEAPLAATKITGKDGPLSVAYLSALDEETSSVTGTGHPLFNVLRVQRDIGGESVIGSTITDKEQGGAFSRLVSADTRVTFDKIYSLQLQAATSTTRDSTGAMSAGPLWLARLQRAGRTFGFDYFIKGIDPNFVAASGFISRAGVGTMSLDHRVTFYAPPGGLIETYGGDVRYAGTWEYRSLTALRTAEDQRYQFNVSATLRGGWQVGGAVYLESYGYDPTIYTNYYLASVNGTDTTYTHFQNQKNLPNTDLVATLYSPQFAHFSLSIVEVWGKDENFYEWSSAAVQLPSIGITWQPTPRSRANGTFNAQYYWRRTDHSLIAQTIIPRLDVEYQLSRSTFIRVVGQYDAAYQDSLRDDGRTNLPIFIRNSSGALARASAYSSNLFSGSVLFSYRPVPGTVAFIGYGNDSVEPGALQFNALRRQDDNFFVKFSYLFRLN
ncbi:MAG TPA: DUF5916 domain-containing protein [Gemmatimonadaceae bacterium]